jgi:hypothetical protein
MRKLPLLAVIFLTHCARNSGPLSPQPEEDRSIVFPKFFERFPTTITQPGELYQLDGVVLAAIATAANDFAPKDRKNIPCWDRQEAYNYQFIRQGDIIFVRIDHNTDYCEHNLLIFDGGAQYAISLDGRILRRVFDGEPDGVSPPPPADANGEGSSGLTSIPPSALGSLHGPPDPNFLEFVRQKKAAEAARKDAGLPLPQALDGGSPAPLDGGSPTALDGGL